MNDLSEFEQELKHVLQPVAPSADFTDAVMARVAGQIRVLPEQTRLRVLSGGRSRALWPALAAAMLLVALGGSEAIHQEHERRMAALNQERFAVAMRVTGRTLAHIDEEVARAGVKETR